LIIDNIYLIIPIILNNKEKIRKCFRLILELLLKNDESLKIDEINLNAIFNDKLILSHLFDSFINLLIDTTTPNAE
jgi:hypothetical protein